MATAGTEFIIKRQLRPCVVTTKDGDKNALFHQWSDQSELIGPSLMRGGHNGGTLKYTVAIVEYEDGKVAEVGPQYIRFLDNQHTEFAFTEREA